VVLYDQDEKAVAQTAHTLVQRGFDNVYVLTGGLVDFADEYPDRIEGLPLPKKPVDPSKKVVTKEVYKTASALTTTGGGGPKSVKSSATRKKETASDVSSVMSSLSVADSVISKATARKARVATTNSYR
jgi:centrosomal protein CEP41